MGHSPFSQTHEPVSVEIKEFFPVHGKKLDTNVICSWSDKDNATPVDPKRLIPTDHNTVALQNGSSQLDLVEHFLALSALMQRRMHLHFPDGLTPLAAPEMGRIVRMIRRLWTQYSDIKYVTPDREIEYTEGDQHVVISPTKNPRLHIASYLDFRDYEPLEWLGEQESFYDSTTRSS